MRTTLMAIAIAVIGQSSPSITPLRAQEILALRSYIVWCTDVSVPRDVVDDPHYMPKLTEAVATIDAALTKETSTGTPFIAKSINQEAGSDHNGQSIQRDTVLISVCESVPESAGSPSSSNIYREARQNEIVIANSCAIANANTCFDSLRLSLVARLDGSLKKSVGTLFWRSVGSKNESPDRNDMTNILTSSDIRQVTITPTVTGSLPAVRAEVIDTPNLPNQSNPQFSGIAAVLTKPIEEQEPRPLMTEKPDWFDFLRQPDDKAIIVAITLSPEIAEALTPK
jgi:hypothetical protein